MPWSSITGPYRYEAFGYALATVLALTEVAILTLALNPRPHADYRAYYIDRTTTCLNRDVVGSYTIGQTISFRQDGAKQAASIKVCGWTGPVGDGTHSLGETSRLRVEIPALDNGLKATLVMSAFIRPPRFKQRVVIRVNGVRAYGVTLSDEETQTVSFVIPDTAPAKAKTLDIALDYLDGVAPSPAASNIYKRAIKLVSFRLEAMDSGRK